MKIEQEIFKDISGYEGLYQISNKGTVKSISFRNNQTTFYREKIMNPFDNGRGYLVITLNRCGKKKNFYIHRLVAEAFIQHGIDENVVNHKDHNTHNNDVANLEWCTQKENVLYSAHRMKCEKSKSKPTNTGEKYISLYKSHGKYLVYRVQIKKIGTSRQFKTLEEAIAYKREVMGDVR